MNNPRATRYDTIVVGGGQSGLAAGYCLRRVGRSFLIVDAEARTGDTWRRRWDSLRLFSPAQYDGLPGLPFPAPDGSFPTKDEMADYLESYARRFDLPVVNGARVTSISRQGGQMVVECSGSRLIGSNVIVASGAYSRPRVPEFALQLDRRIRQLHSSDYRRASDVRGGAVAVVGFGTSGVEIATELARAGREVVLTGRPTAQVLSKFVPAIFASTGPVGKLWGRAYWRLIERVVTVDTRVGRKAKAQAMRRGQPLFRLNRQDALGAGVAHAPRVAGVEDGRLRLENGRVLEVDAVVWCTGFLPNYSFLDLAALPLDEKGWPVTDHGAVPQVPGLYFLGVPFQVGVTSTLVGGAGRDAEMVVSRIVRERTVSLFRNADPAGLRRSAGRGQ